MSIYVMSFVWDRFDGDDTLLLLALALSDYANDDGAGIYASMPTLASKIRRDERTARRQVRALEEIGFLEATGPAPAPYVGTSYRIPAEWLLVRGYQAPHKGRRGPRPGGGTMPPEQPVDESAGVGAPCPHPGGTKPGDPGASCPDTRGHHAPQSFLRNPEEIPPIRSARAHARPTGDDPEAKAALKAQRRAELAELAEQYGRAGFRRPLTVETPTSYRTQYRLWLQQQRAAGAPVEVSP